MIAITVSSKYDDLLKIIMPQNYKYFEKWIIVTDMNDTDTIKVIEDYNYPNVCIVFFDFYENGKTFNKGGAIRFCQEKILSDYVGSVLILDSDIYLPDNFIDLLQNITIEDGMIYGTDKRYDYYSLEHFKNNIIDYYYPNSHEFEGYFQLYKHSKDKLYQESHNCSTCDIQFKKYFHTGVIVSRLEVRHLGRSGINWDTRKNKNDFLQS
jgi:hypothetical protein